VHAARYAYAASFAGKKRVLDVACGTGGGLRILSEAGARVIAVDFDKTAVVKARASSGGGALVLVGSASELPFGRGAVDLVTSFETLEHLEERAHFLAEVRRVLRASGELLLSTPNANHTRPINGKPRNPHHVHEYTPAELSRELSDHFPDVSVLGQTLHPRYRVPPFQDQQQALTARGGLRTELFVWRVINKLPTTLREWTSRLLWRRPFFPGESDYEFSPATVDWAPVLLAICRPERPRASG
jgi:SAM-dependent methyltransferase